MNFKNRDLLEVSREWALLFNSSKKNQCVYNHFTYRRCRHSHGRTQNEPDAKNEHTYENEDFVVQNRQQNHACPEVASERERPESANRYEQVVFKPNTTSDF